MPSRTSCRRRETEVATTQLKDIAHTLTRTAVHRSVLVRTVPGIAQIARHAARNKTASVKARTVLRQIGVSADDASRFR